MIEVAVARQYVFSRSGLGHPNLAAFPQFQLATRPIYWVWPEQDAPSLFVVFTVIGGDDVRTQESLLEYVEITIEMAVIEEDRSSHLAYAGAPSNYIKLAALLDELLTVPAAPTQIGPNADIPSAYEVTCDRISMRPIVARDYSVKSFTLSAQYRLRVQLLPR